MGTQSGRPETEPAPSTQSEQPESPGRPRRRGSPFAVLPGLSLLLVGVGALLISGSFDDDPTVRLAGHDSPVNASARRADDLSAHNSPTLVRNPVRPASLAVSSRIDTPN